MSRATGYILAGLVAVLVFQLVVVLPRAVNEPNVPEAEALQEHVEADVEQGMDGVHSVEIKDGEREFELWAQQGLAFKTRNVLELRQVRVLFFAKNGVEFTVTGEQGEIETKTKDISISGNVVTKSSNGYVLRTQKVNYDSAGRTLVSHSSVEMVGPKDTEGHVMILRGEQMSANLTDALIIVRKNVRAEKTFEKERRVVIHSDESQFSGKERMARFNGNVIIDMDGMRITGPDAEFEYDSSRELVKSIFVKGGVRVSDTEKYATAQNLKVEFEEDKFIFKGNPRVVQDSDELRGEEIIFLDGGRKVQVMKARAKVDAKSLESVN